MKYHPIIAVVSILLLTSACSTGHKPLETVIKGTITVADSLDDTGDYSGIGITVINPDTSSKVLEDTLLNVTTDKLGFFEGSVQFPSKRYYTLYLSRHGRDIGNLGVILANQDTLTITMQLPGINETVSLQSREHEAMKTFRRVDRNFQRVTTIASNTMSDSEFAEEVKKWTDLYWEVYEKHENTIAGIFAAEKSINLLNAWDRDEMLVRLDKTLPEDYMMSVALNLATPYIAEEKGFEAASSYLDSLARITSNESIREIIQQEKIKMYFDSSQVKEAKTLLADYEENYNEKPSSKQWAQRIRYDLNYLAPGVSVPDFHFITAQGDSISNHSLQGDVYILEFSPLANTEYQNDYDRTLIIHEIYKNYGLKIFTIPLDQSEITVNAFFEERRKAWPVIKLGTFDVQETIQKFNVVQIPTRILIDKNGVIIRKYERGEFEEVIQGLNKAFRNTNSPS